MTMENERFWKLLEPIHDSAAAFCRKLTGSYDDGNDLYQDALMTAVRKFDTLNDIGAFKAWLFRILINKFKNHSRSFWRRNRVNLTPEMIETGPSTDPREDFKTLRALSALLSILSAEDRAIVVLHEIDGWPIIEMAGVLKMPEGTIKTRLFRARQKMIKSVRKKLPLKGVTLTSEAAYALRRTEE